MLSELNIIKPLNSSMYSIAKKCGWKNIDSTRSKVKQK